MMHIPSNRFLFRGTLPIAILVLAMNLSGCGMSGGANVASSTASSSTSTAEAMIQGKTFGGEQPVIGATIQLYAAGAPGSGGGYGQGAVALLAPANEPVTDSSGFFSIGPYSCPLTPAVSQVYIVATGGSSGLGNPVNSKIALMAGLGACPAGGTLNPNRNVWINEVTTIASVYALQQFMAPPSSTNVGAPVIGAPGTTYNGVQSAVIGLRNAFGMIPNLTDTRTGAAETPENSWATSDNDGKSINTLADILVYCVNSNPLAASPTACTTLFTDATPSGSTTAADTIQAAWYIAQNPSHNVTALYRLISGTPPFTAVGTTPNDFTIAVNLSPQYTPVATATYAVDTPHNVAIDAYGNVWVNNVHGTSGINSASVAQAGVVELAPNGSVLMAPVSSFTASKTGGTYSQFTTAPSVTVPISPGSRMLAIDTSNNIWVANYSSSLGTPAAGSVAYFNGSTGVGVAGSVNGGYFVGNSPWGLAIDGHNNVYVSNTGNTGMDPLSVGKFALGTGTYTYSTSGGATATQQLPNVKAVTGGTGGFNYYGTGGWSAVMAVDTNTGVTSGADGVLWTASPQCVTSSSQYDTGNNIAWGIVSQFNADTLTALSESQATTSTSGASPGAGSTTNCGSTTTGTLGDVALSGAGLQIGQVFTAPMASPFGVAIDRNNGVWIADASYTAYSPGFNGLTHLTAPSASSGLIPNSAYIVNGAFTSATTTPTTGQTQQKTAYIAVDGNNNVWGANQGFPTFFEASYNSTTNAIAYLVPATTQGFYHATMSSTVGVAIDLSGNVWATNTGTTATYPGQAGGPATPYVGASLSVLVGAAAPVVTPLSEAVAANMLGQKP